MLHSLQPAQFVFAQYLPTPWQCPECNSAYVYGNGVMSLAHHQEADTGEVRRGLPCFCSTKCLLPRAAGAHLLSWSADLHVRSSRYSRRSS
jgi:hypothetical protein